MNTFELTNRRYLGSKAKLLTFIHEVVDNNCSNVETFLDIFGGTGCVGYSFNEKFNVIENDILKSNLVAYDTFFSNANIDLNKIENIISKYNEINPTKENYFSLNFANTYLSETNMRKVGYIRDDIDAKYNKNEINEREKSILVCSLLYSIDKIANTVGHYDAYRKNGDLDRELVMFLPNINDKFNSGNQIFNEDANVLATKIISDITYIDPPYNSRQYCDAYHFLENVAENKKKEVQGVAKKIDRSEIKSKYCGSKAPEEFRKLINSLNTKYILVSYNNTGEKGNARSNARISDYQILEILKAKGEVKVFEQEHSLFTTGKTKFSDHKERLFLCTVGEDASKTLNKKIEKNIIKSPLNYTGGKYPIVDQLMNKYPKNIKTFYDIFSGGANVGINSNSDKIICIDNNPQLISLMNFLKKNDYYELVDYLDKMIDKFSLSNTYLNGYEYYNCNSSNGVGSYNKEGFLKLREAYNLADEKDDDLFLLLIIFSFNNQIRFNTKGEFNLPVGKRDFNGSLRKKLYDFMLALKNKNITFVNEDFTDINLDKVDIENDYFYLDPPYYLGLATYNENGGWTEKDEKKLLDFLSLCDSKGIRFGLSNVIEHKGKKHEMLINWCLSNSFNINYINYSYKNSNYHIKNRDQITKEVFITNY